MATAKSVIKFWCQLIWSHESLCCWWCFIVTLEMFGTGNATHNPYQTVQVINFYGFFCHLLFIYYVDSGVLNVGFCIILYLGSQIMNVRETDNKLMGFSKFHYFERLFMRLVLHNWLNLKVIIWVFPLF